MIPLASVLFYFGLPIFANGMPIDLKLSPAELQEAAGPVQKKEGVRNDIAQYIEARSQGSALKRLSLRQLALDYQEMIVNILRPEFAQVFAVQAVHSEFCVRYAFGEQGHREAALVHGKTLNTYLRARIGIRMNTYLARAYPYLPAPSEWVKDCRFLVTENNK